MWINKEEYEKLQCCKTKMQEIDAIEEAVKGAIWDNIEVGKRYVGMFIDRGMFHRTVGVRVIELSPNKEMVKISYRGWITPKEFMDKVICELERNHAAQV